MKLAIATCQYFPTGVADDAPLFSALDEMGFEISHHIWNQPVNWAEFDACLIRTIWDYHDHPQQFAQWLTTVSEQTRLINDCQVVRWNLIKSYLQDLSDFGVTIAPTYWLKNQHDTNWQSWCQDNPASMYFLKPAVGANSAGTLHFKLTEDGLDKVNKHLQEWLPKGTMMLQPYFQQVETFGETSAIYFAGNFSHAVRKIPVKGDYRVQDTFGATDVNYQMTPGEMALSKACLQYLDMTFGTPAYARFDFLHDSTGGIYLNEAELIEPSLFFNHGGKKAARLMARAIRNHLLPEVDASADSD
ncbi:RimK family alpha-L-glutamate ligase [Marinicella sediminis]|uniref:RimK family alpha-L-glutamate ligase n=1 Tax=Marinicella sediminis TaxID=1792834 RepID=A0ABV7JD33_9GAMM|nr:hypothetical protein [Marinicella sediminis]